MCVISDTGNLVSELLLSDKDMSCGQKRKNIVVDRHMFITDVADGVLMSIKYCDSEDVYGSKTFEAKVQGYLNEHNNSRYFNYQPKTSFGGINY